MNSRSPYGCGFLATGPHLVALALLLGLLLPRSIEAVAAKIGFEMHVTLFLIGPAIYSTAHGLVPSIDYFTLYSVGLPYLFAWFIDGSAADAVLNYTRLMIAAMVFFYWGLFYALWWLYSSWRWALGVAVTTMILQFHVDRTFFDPSSYVLRYPLLVVTVAAVAMWIGDGQRFKRGFAVSAAIAGSLFLNTETGIYLLLATLFVGVSASRCDGRRLTSTAAILFGSLAMFGVICLAAFGPGTLQVAFVSGLLEPLFIFGGGAGGWAIDWRWNWHLLYNIIAPGATVATMAWCSVQLWRGPVDASLAARLCCLSMFAALGIMMSAKYANMSIVALWHVNALGFLIVLGHWARTLQLTMVGRAGGGESARKAASWGVGSASAILAALLLWTPDDPRNPALYAFKAYLRYPSILNILAEQHQPPCRELQCAIPRIHSDDVQMIRRLVPENEPAAVFGANDWAYLIEARRRPWFRFLPSRVLFTRSAFAAAKYPPDLVFLPNKSDSNRGIEHPELAKAWLPRLTRDYALVEQGHDIVAWRRVR